MQLARRAMAISPSPTLAIDAQAKAMQKQGIKVINFGVGEPDFDTPRHIKEAAVKAIDDGFTKYTPVAGFPDLRQAIADKLRLENQLNYETSQIVVSSGAKHALYNALHVLCNEGDEVILPAPYWVSYIEQVKLAGATPKIIPVSEDNGFKITAAQLAAAVGPRTRGLILNSPSNPTGTVYNRKELEELAEVIARCDLFVISDEIYEKLIYDGCEHVSIAALGPDMQGRTVVVNGVSKAYSMTGWRIGYAAAAPEVAKAMADIQSHATSNASSIAQKAALVALTGNQEAVHNMREEFWRRRDYMWERLQGIPGIKCNKPAGAFYLFPNVSGLFGRKLQGQVINSASDLARVLLNVAQVAVVPGVAFGDDRYLRFSYATSLANIQEGLDRFSKVCTSLF